MPPINNSSLSLNEEEGDIVTVDIIDLYKKLLTLLPNLEYVPPNSSFQIVAANNERATVTIRGFNDNPAEKIGVEIMRMESAKTVSDEHGKQTIVSPPLRHAPTLIFEFNKQNKDVQAYAIYDDRPDRTYGQVKLEINEQQEYVETGADKALNQKLDDYITEFIEMGYELD